MKKRTFACEPNVKTVFLLGQTPFTAIGRNMDQILIFELWQIMYECNYAVYVQYVIGKTKIEYEV